MYAQVLGCQITEKDNLYYNELKEAVITVDIMLDKLIIKVDPCQAIGHCIVLLSICLCRMSN